MGKINEIGETFGKDTDKINERWCLPEELEEEQN